MSSHQKRFTTDASTGIVTMHLMFPAGTGPGTVGEVEKVVPTIPTPGREMSARWITLPDGARELLIGEVLAGDTPPAIDELDNMSLKELLTIGGKEGLNGKNGAICLNNQMALPKIRQFIRANRKNASKVKPVVEDKIPAGV